MNCNIPARPDGCGLCGGKPVSIPEFCQVDAGHHAVDVWSPAHSIIFARSERIFSRRQGADGSCSQAVRVRIISACLSAGDGPRDCSATQLRVAGNNKKTARRYRVPKAEAFQRLRYSMNDILERAANLAARQLSLISPMLDRDVIDARGTIPLRQDGFVCERNCRRWCFGRCFGQGRNLRLFYRGSDGDLKWGQSFGRIFDLLAFIRYLWGLNLFCGKLSCKRAARALFYVSPYEGLLNFDLLLR